MTEKDNFSKLFFLIRILLKDDCYHMQSVMANKSGKEAKFWEKARTRTLTANVKKTNEIYFKSKH